MQAQAELCCNHKMKAQMIEEICISPSKTTLEHFNNFYVTQKSNTL